MHILADMLGAASCTNGRDGGTKAVTMLRMLRGAFGPGDNKVLTVALFVMPAWILVPI